MRGKSILLLAAVSISPALALDVLVGDRSGAIDKVQRFDGFTGAFLNDFADATSGLNAPRGIARGPDNRIYVSSYDSDQIIRYDAVSGAKIDTYVAAGSGGLDGPQGLVFGPEDGNLYVSSRNTNSVKRYEGPTGATPGAYISDFVTSASGGLVQPSGLVFGKDVWPADNPLLAPHRDGIGELLVCSFGTNSVKWYNGVTGEYIKEFVAPNHAGLSNPTDLIFDPGPLEAADLLISSFGSNLVLRVSGTCSTSDQCGAWGFAFAEGNGLQSPYGLAYGPDVNGDNAPDLLVASLGTNMVKRFRGPNGAGGGQYINDFITGLTQPGPVLVSCDGKPPAILTSVVNDYGQGGLGSPAPHTLRVTGTDLGDITGLRLVRSQIGSQQINTTSFQVIDSSTLEATFDLANAEAGRFDIVATDPCGLANPLRKAFLVYLPELTNAGFEEGATADATTGEFCDSVASNGNRPRSKHWDLGQVAFVPQLDLKRDGNIWHICDNGVALGRTGEHHASMMANNTNEGYFGMFQTIAAPAVVNGISTAEYRLYGDFSVKSCQGVSPATMVMRDGTENGPVISETEVPYTPENGLVSSQAFTVAVPLGQIYVSDPPILTVELRFNTGPGDECGHGLKAVHVDNLRPKFSTAICNTPWADIDGDTDVDSADFAVFQQCYTMGNPAAPLPEACECFDQPVPPAIVGDGAIDLADLASFVNCSTGPEISWSQELTPNCHP